jgi:plastocyanin
MNESGCLIVFMVINVCHFALSVAAGLALFLTSCGGGTSTSGSTGAAGVTTTAVSAAPGSSTAGAGDQDIVVQGYKFPPITAAAGSMLTLESRDLEPHTVTADNGSFDSGPFTPKKPATLTVPTAPGSYAFHCKVHPTMHGTLVVQ